MGCYSTRIIIMMINKVIKQYTLTDVWLNETIYICCTLHPTNPAARGTSPARSYFLARFPSPFFGGALPRSARNRFISSLKS